MLPSRHQKVSSDTNNNSNESAAAKRPPHLSKDSNDSTIESGEIPTSDAGSDNNSNSPRSRHAGC